MHIVFKKPLVKKVLNKCDSVYNLNKSIRNALVQFLEFPRNQRRCNNYTLVGFFVSKNI